MIIIDKLKKLIDKKKHITNKSYLEKNIKRFEYIATIISKEKIEILNSHDKIGSYYENKLILPETVNISKKNNINIKCYIYKIIFAIFSRKLGFYLPENKKQIDYIYLASIITIKTIIETIDTKFKSFNKIKKCVYSAIKYSENVNKNKYNILEIVSAKITYKKIEKTFILSKEEKKFIYDLENIKSVTKKNFNNLVKNNYNKYIRIKNTSKEIKLNFLWGYLYYKNHKNNNMSQIIKMSNKKQNTLHIYDKNQIIKSKNKTKKKNNETMLNLLFEYKKTIDKYKKGNKNPDTTQLENKITLIKNINMEYSIRNNNTISCGIKHKIINKINIAKLDKIQNNLKKYRYKEWDFNLNTYKKNWCNVYTNDEKKSDYDKTYLTKILNKHKNIITVLKNKIQLINNKKLWKKNYIHGDDLDLDTIIDNYKSITNANFNKIYKKKKYMYMDTIITIIFDSSLSTDSFIKKKKIIELLKELVIIIAFSIENKIKYSIATFYSNTRHDCAYKIIKKFEEKHTKKLISIENIYPNGYTRIGPSIRHATNQIKNMKSKKKIILVLTDGSPTDYDEYEGDYGINDIKMSIKEAKKQNITIRSIIINTNNSSINFTKMFGNKNYQTLSNEKTIYKNLSNFISKILLY